MESLLKINDKKVYLKKFKKGNRVSAPLLLQSQGFKSSQHFNSRSDPIYFYSLTEAVWTDLGLTSRTTIFLEQVT